MYSLLQSGRTKHQVFNKCLTIKYYYTSKGQIKNTSHIILIKGSKNKCVHMHVKGQTKGQLNECNETFTASRKKNPYSKTIAPSHWAKNTDMFPLKNNWTHHWVSCTVDPCRMTPLPLRPPNGSCSLHQHALSLLLRGQDPCLCHLLSPRFRTVPGTLEVQ